MNILVVGFYGQNNLGDESFKKMIPYFFIGHTLTFAAIDNIPNVLDYDALIVGGGDVINNYFHDYLRPLLNIFDGVKFAFGIGFPFQHLITEEYLGKYDHVFTRSYSDLRLLQKVVGSERAHYLPDVCLAYDGLSVQPRNYDNKLKKGLSLKLFKSKPQKTCGFFPVGNLIAYPRIVDELANFLRKLSQKFQITIYSFNITEDLPLAKLLAEKVNKKSLKVDENQYGMRTMIDIIDDLDFAVCMRYHSHIFCTITGTPFFSISSTRKNTAYIKQLGLTKYQYRIPLDSYFNPVSIDPIQLNYSLENTLANLEAIHYKLTDFIQWTKPLFQGCKAVRLLELAHLKKSPLKEIVDFHQQYKSCNDTARLISDRIIGFPDSPYIWGISEKLKLTDKVETVIEDAVSYLKGNAQHFIELTENVKMYKKKIPAYIDLSQYMNYKEVHRGGWFLAAEQLYGRNAKNSNKVPNGIIVDFYLDKSFHWSLKYMIATGKLPYTGPWCGFIHHTACEEYSEYNIVKLLEIKEFKQSLPTCLALFTLSEISTKYLKTKLSGVAPQIQIITFNHPVVDTEIYFNLGNYQSNPAPKLINVGAWLRNPFTIYTLELDTKIQKAVLKGKDMFSYLPPANFHLAVNIETETVVENVTEDCAPSVPCRPVCEPVTKWVEMVIKWLNEIKIKTERYYQGVLYVNANQSTVDYLNEKLAKMLASVQELEFLGNEAYDRLLSENLVFLHLFDCAAVNTVIECIVRGTPMVINKIPGTIQLLGENYPLFYEHTDQIPSLLKLEKIQAAHLYLMNMEIDKYSLTSFIRQFDKVMNDLDEQYTNNN